MKREALILIVILIGLVVGLTYSLTRQPHEIVLAGMVRTDQVIVSAEFQGRLQRLLVKEGDSATNIWLLFQ